MPLVSWESWVSTLRAISAGFGIRMQDMRYHNLPAPHPTHLLQPPPPPPLLLLLRVPGPSRERRT